MPDISQRADGAGKDLDIFDFLAFLWKQRVSIAGAALAGLGLSLLFALLNLRTKPDPNIVQYSISIQTRNSTQESTKRVQKFKDGLEQSILAKNLDARLKAALGKRADLAPQDAGMAFVMSTAKGIEIQLPKSVAAKLPATFLSVMVTSELDQLRQQKRTAYEKNAERIKANYEKQAGIIHELITSSAKSGDLAAALAEGIIGRAQRPGGAGLVDERDLFLLMSTLPPSIRESFRDRADEFLSLSASTDELMRTREEPFDTSAPLATSDIFSVSVDQLSEKSAYKSTLLACVVGLFFGSILGILFSAARQFVRAHTLRLKSIVESQR